MTKGHHHHFTDDGINVNYCTHDDGSGEICPIAQDKEFGKIGEFIVIKGQGYVK